MTKGSAFVASEHLPGNQGLGCGGGLTQRYSIQTPIGGTLY